MANPYEILGVPETATEEQIKDAYRDLARKYGDEAYMGGPLADVAKQKMEELDRAYDIIVAERRGQEPPRYDANTNTGSQSQTANGGYQNTYNAGYSNPYNDYTYAPSQFSDVRAKINGGRIDDAETILNGIPRVQRTAEWYFLKGQIQQRRGWLDEALKNYTTACQMEPGNKEYADAYAALHRNASGGYRQTGRGGGCTNPCDLCSSLLCADCCCECMGGDLIPGC